ncbi:sulfite exporter TauE/SafE family protein [Hydrogenophilus thiooxidans]|uniref:sulfite exporter TauE/SafE family protein n=1 Tax=Hydrogenophilus thiooxidans TaxID=2820326 RepID=UPI002016EA9E|nr:sulfite exporter TauE/SafE family protein [Hydrogenophilus thiooxidans]
MLDPTLIAAGALTGFVVGLTGVGGGALMTPILLLFFGVNPFTAVGTDLWFSALTKLFASRAHHAHGLIDWGVARRLWMGSLPAAGLTLLAIHYAPITAATVAFLKGVIAVAVLVTAVGLLLHKPLHALGQKWRTQKAHRFKTVQMPLTVAAGALLGVLVTLTSVGAGALGAVLLTYLYPFRLTPPRLIATDIVHAIPLTVCAGVGHLAIGNVDFTLLGNLLIGSIPAVLAGAMLSVRLPHTFLRTALALVLFLIGLKMALACCGF